MAARKKKPNASSRAIARVPAISGITIPLPPDLVRLIESRVGMVTDLYALAVAVVEDATKLRELAEKAAAAARILHKDGTSIASAVRRRRR